MNEKTMTKARLIYGMRTNRGGYMHEEQREMRYYKGSITSMTCILCEKRKLRLNAR